MLKIFGETFRKNVESNIFSQQMLIPKNVSSTFCEKCWFNILDEKCCDLFYKMLKYFVVTLGK
jgi:hypothetical protein